MITSINEFKKRSINEGLASESDTILYKELINKYPYMNEIFEKHLYIAPQYALHSIWDQDHRTTFYFNQSMSVDFGNKETSELLIRYNVSIQFPGNQDYNFSISVNKII